MTDAPQALPEPQNETPRENLIAQAGYVAAELASGDAVPVATLIKARPFVETLLKELAAVNADAKTDTAKLQLAMIDVMAAIAPVTVSSLQDTECSGRHRRGWFWLFGNFAAEGDADHPVGEVKQFSDRLVIASIAFLIAALGTTLTLMVLDAHILAAAKALVEAGLKSCEGAVKNMTDAEAFKALAKGGLKVCGEAIKKLNETSAKTGNLIAWRVALEVIQPVVYGGLGACVYLLRSLHKHIYERTFDRRYQPEYVNRVVLGMISGAVVTLLAAQIQLIPELSKIGAAALAFIIGYNTDLLFSLIERISYALFPKVPDPPPATVTPPLQPQKSDGDGQGDGKGGGK